MEENKLKTIEGELEAPADFTSPDVLYRDLVANIRKYHPSDDLSMIEKAYQLADNAHKDQKRKSGEPYIIHPLCVAIILADLEMDKESRTSPRRGGRYHIYRGTARRDLRKRGCPLSRRCYKADPVILVGG